MTVGRPRKPKGEHYTKRLVVLLTPSQREDLDRLIEERYRFIRPAEAVRIMILEACKNK